MRNIVYIFLILAICSLAGSALATERYVVRPGTIENSKDIPPYNTWTNAATNIQWAVNVATNGDTVWVSNGTYYCSGVSTSVFTSCGTINTNTAMVVITNSITVQSVNGYANTIVDGNYPSWTTVVFHVNNTGAVLSGLTITNGFATTNTIVSAVTVRIAGVGVYFNGSLVTNCLITGNIFSNTVGLQSLHGGAAICVDSGTVSHCIIRGNRAIGNYVYGPGLMANQGGTAAKPIIVKNCDVDYNSSYSDLGALRLFYCVNATAIYCNVHDNNNGLDISGSGGVVDSCIISNNRIGIYLDSGGTVKNSLFVSNRVYGVYFDLKAGTVKIENCTVVSNAVGLSFNTLTTSVFRAVNCIIYDNTVNWTHGGTNMSYTNCCTYPIPTNVSDRSIGAGNITNEPMFAERSSRNYRLGANSPCINTGTNQNWMINGVDLDGRMRIRYGRVDMGAYERIIEGTIYGFR